MSSVTLDSLKAALPASGLRDGTEWLFSPIPFSLSKQEAKKITRLGHPLAMFQRASESIYQRSSSGNLPRWISELLDTGKPEWMLAVQKSPQLQHVLPRVIRPDLILTDEGFSLTELDSVPGGMGITTWLSHQYAQAGFDVLGGADGIPDGFAKLLPEGGDILISEESADYRPEMEYLSRQLSTTLEVKSVEELEEVSATAYRFFEWFDWENIPAAQELASQLQLTPPCKPHLEEKLWLALLWSPGLQSIWKQEMRSAHLDRVKEIVPFGWVTDPAPLPPHASFPRLDVQSWEEVGNFTQHERQLVLKISGFNELAWGSRGVKIGHDMPAGEWKEALAHAVEQHHSQPWIMQDFAHGRMVKHPYFDPDSGEEKMMQGRVRICPYFFTDKNGNTEFGGALATIVPADKKKIHGMKDGILVPCMIA